MGFEDAVLQVLMGIRRGEMQTIRYMALKGRLRSWLRNHTHTHIAIIKGVGVLIAEYAPLPLKTTSSKQMTESKGLDQPLPSPISDPYIFPHTPRAPL